MSYLYCNIKNMLSNTAELNSITKDSLQSLCFQLKNYIVVMQSLQQHPNIKNGRYWRCKYCRLSLHAKKQNKVVYKNRKNYKWHNKTQIFQWSCYSTSSLVWKYSVFGMDDQGAIINSKKAKCNMLSVQGRKQIQFRKALKIMAFGSFYRIQAE